MKKTAVLALLFLPSVAFGAGFAKQSLFLSKASVTEGDTVYIHAVVSNDAASSFKGEMVFSDNGVRVGTAPVSLDAGEASAVSVSWKPSAGSHPVVAELMKGTESIEKQSATFAVAKKPEPKAPQAASQSAAAVESSEKIQESIASFSPAAAEATAPFFTLVDGGRESLSNTIDGQIETAKRNIGPENEGSVLGAEAVKNAPSNPMGTFWFILWTLYLYILTLLNFIIGNAGVFYPVLALLVLYFLWKIVQRFRRPAY